jgi:hypothetical protein
MIADLALKSFDAADAAWILGKSEEMQATHVAHRDRLSKELAAVFDSCYLLISGFPQCPFRDS